MNPVLKQHSDESQNVRLEGYDCKVSKLGLA